FVILSTLLGIITARWGHLSLPYAGLAVILLQFFGNRLVDRDLRRAEAAMPPEDTDLSASVNSSSLVAFVRKNKMFCLMIFGPIIIFIAHNMDGNFLINEVEALGGHSAIMGYVAAFTAITEVPVMLFASKLPKTWETVQYIRLSFVFFVIKILAYALAPSIPLFFAARVLQAPSYALYTVLIVGYADRQVDRKDSAKAQSLAFSMTTIGSVLASLIGGRMFDTIGVQPTMLTAAAIAAVGAVIALAGTLGKKAA
ncbi:MAG: MFS transporter, partial [Clostridia bacterium]|nr:MFS transporter [Clostridia bacterium]